MSSEAIMFIEKRASYARITALIRPRREETPRNRVPSVPQPRCKATGCDLVVANAGLCRKHFNERQKPLNQKARAKRKAKVA